MTQTLLIAVVAFLPDSPPNNFPTPKERVEVFRYLPGLLDAYREARQQDHRQIWKTIKDLEIAYSSESSGSGVVIRLYKPDLIRWKAAIDKMIENGVLQYYRWGTDMHGYGLIPIK